MKKLSNDIANVYLPTNSGEIPPCPLAMSYGMGGGGNKRADSRVYNSLSGYGFLIGCRSGKVIGFDVLK